MGAQVREGVDLCTGHGGYPPRVADSGSPNHFVNGIPVVRIGDHWVTHCARSCHDGTQASGSPNSFSGGVARARVGDSISCGSSNAEGSPNVFVNG